jgi:23S rRNA (adenine2503-C2)-methyltransferase
VIDLRGLDLTAMQALVTELGERPFRGKQLYRWVHHRAADSIDAMTDLGKAFREKLAAHAGLGSLAIDLVQQSEDGTRKYRLKTGDGRFIEAVFMPETKRRTLCVSSQVGCAMGCGFCRTATMGLIRNLTISEIVSQVYLVEADLREQGWRPEGSPTARGPERILTNLVFMGMGEPLHNLDNLIPALDLLLSEEGMGFSHRHVTVSTSGLVPEIARFGKETRVKLAVSLNATEDAQRERLMPVNRKYPLAALMEACAAFPMKIGRRVTFEYVLLEGVNDSPEDAARLASLVRRVPAKLNLIAYNDNPGLPFHSPPAEDVEAFRADLETRGVAVFVRKNRGRDIAAACGQLAVEGQKRARREPHGALSLSAD